MSDVLSETDLAVLTEFVDGLLDGTEHALLKLSVRTSAVTVDRWGRDLERDPDEQQWSDFEDALADAVDDVLAHYEDDDAHVDGVDGLVFEGRVVDEDLLTEGALRVTEVIESEGDFDRNTPGGVIDRVDGRAA